MSKRLNCLLDEVQNAAIGACMDQDCTVIYNCDIEVIFRWDLSCLAKVFDWSGVTKPWDLTVVLNP